MAYSFLIGNGINRCIDNKYSADNLIKNLDSENKEISECKKPFPFPLLFESLTKQNKESVETHFIKIKDLLKDLNKTKNDIYINNKELLLKANYIFTTNYDFSIEESLGINKELDSIKGNRNSGFKYQLEQDSAIIYHIHGDLNHYRNICLGYLGYQKYQRSFFSHVKKDIIKDKYNKERYIPEKLKSFFEDDIYIIGLSLNECETILWDLLMIRKGLIESGKINENKIIYYDILNQEIDIDINIYIENEKMLKEFYKSFYIDYECSYVLNDNNENKKENEYKEKYFSIFSEIKEKVEVAI